MNYRFILLNTIFLLLVLSSCKHPKVPSTTPVMPSKENSPSYFSPLPNAIFKYQAIGTKREFRGLWVASVANIDWPSKKGLQSDEQKSEFREIVSMSRTTGINALLVQVRAASDAFYARSTEPWSEWLSGVQGNAPTPYYDPMDFMITECHNQGLEFHAWLNLNRGMHKKANSVSDEHLIYQKPEWFLTYDGYKIYNFGIPAVRAYLKEIVLNIVKNYDVDGIHFDDYFYPYKVNGQTLNDEPTFRHYGHGFTNIEDWRRNNIDILIKEIADAIYREKKWVKFGISPFGVWRNKADDPLGSETKGGQPSYDNLYADTRAWAQKGWIDYIAPQIYFPFEHTLVPYAITTDWWVNNHGKALLYIGHGVYRVDSQSEMKAWKDPNQLPRQLAYNRKEPENISGSIFYSANSLQKNNLGVRKAIGSHFNTLSLQPKMPWKDDVLPNAPLNVSLAPIGDMATLVRWDSPSKAAKDGDKPWSYAIYRFSKDEHVNLGKASALIGLVPAHLGNTYLDRNPGNDGSVYVVTSIDRLGNESQAATPVRWNATAR